MPKPVCVKCQRFYRPKKNGVLLTEMAPHEEGAPAGVEKPEAWHPYKIWHSDLWECRGCGHQIINGHGHVPVAENYQDEFAEHLRLSDYVVNDC